MAETTYIPYGQDEISQQDLMTNLANGLPGFMEQYKWLQKPKNKEKFLKAYDNITKNLVGASDNSGRWTINVNNVNIESLSPKDKEIYEHAAYYIQQQMSKMTPRAKEEEKKNENLDKFDFIKSFNQQLLNNYYGGNQTLFEDPEQGWNSLDARGSNGLRGIDKRRERMIEALESYKKGLEGKNFNFEGTSFTDINDANNKIQSAIDALKTSGEEDDLKAFSALGLPYRSYFSNGGNDSYTKGDYTGTYQGYNDYLAQQEQAKQKAEQEKLKTQQANYWTNSTTYDFSKLNGRPLTSQESNANYLDQLFAKGKWSGDEASQIVSAFKLAEKNGQLVPLSKEELTKLEPSRWGNRAKYLKKINGMTTPLYYDTLNKQYKLFHNKQVPQTSFQDVLNQNSPEAIAKNKKLAEQKKIQQANNRKLGEFGNDWKTEDYLRMGAMAQDIAGGLAAWAPVYGTATSAGLGLTSMLTNLSADAMDDSLTKGDVIKNAGVNLGLGLVGMVPGLGLASRTGKWLTNIAKWAPRLLTLQAIKDLPDSYNSLQKAINNPKELTNQDWKNIAYGLSVAAGLSRGAAGIKNNIKYKPAFKGTSQSEQFIKTKNGKEIKVTDEQLKKLNKIGHKEGTAKANEYLQKELNAGKDEVLDFEFKTGKVASLIGNSIKAQKKNATKGLSPQQQRLAKYYELIQQREEAKNPRLSRFTNYNIYKNMANFNAPSWRNPFSNFTVINPAKKFKGGIHSPKTTQVYHSGVVPYNFGIRQPIQAQIPGPFKYYYKQGGQINSLDNIIEDFINNNNI